MSDGLARTGFARLVSSVAATVFSLECDWRAVADMQMIAGSRSERKKVKGERKLSHALMRSSFGGSED